MTQWDKSKTSVIKDKGKKMQDIWIDASFRQLETKDGIRNDRCLFNVMKN